ncbi:metallophosphoesterase family protein [Leucobacter sp. HY1910]
MSPAPAWKTELAHADRVVIAGDWHARRPWMEAALLAASRTGAKHVLHVGDFGYWPGFRAGPRYLARANELCAMLGLELVILAGNHEDHDRWDPGQRDYPTMRLLPRAGSLTLGGRRLTWMQGAASIDRAHRREGHDWFAAELPTDADVSTARQETVGLADILLTHEAPLVATPSVVQARLRNPLGLPESVRAYAHQGATLVQELADAVQPRLHFHGHWHMPERQHFDETPGRRAHEVISLGMDYQPGNLMLLDTAALTAEPVTVPAERERSV